MAAGRRKAATLIGLVAIATWAMLAFLSAAAGPVPPFQLAAMTFGIGGLAGAAGWPFRPGALAALRQPWPVWALGIGGLAIYHALYFFAIQAAPPVEVSLIAYLWPLLIVVMAAMLPGERLRVHHLLGVAAGLAGAGLIITRGFASGIAEGFQPGHGLALAAAFVWSGYSVLTRRFPAVPTDVVAGYCLATALLTLGLHLALEETVWPATGGAWAAVAALGLLPLGLAFYAWDHGCKHGDIMVLGALSYLAPPVSVIILVASGHAAFHWSIAAGCLLVVAGALVASRDMLRRPAPAEGSPA